MAAHVAMADTSVPMRSAALVLGELPPAVRFALAFAPPAQAQTAFASFAQGCEQRLLAQEKERLATLLRRRFGLEPFSAEDLAAAGLDPQAGLVVFAMPGAAEPMLLGRVADETKFQAFVTSLLAGHDQRATETIGAASLIVPPPAPAGEPPWPSYAREGPMVWMEGGGGAEALRSLLRLRARHDMLAKRPDWPRTWLLSANEGAWLSAYVPHAASGACAGVVGEVLTVRMGLAGVDAQGVTLGALGEACLRGARSVAWPAPHSPEPAPYVRWQGATVRDAVAWWPSVRQHLSLGHLEAQHPARPLVTTAVRGVAALDRLLATHPQLDGPFRLRVGGPLTQPEATWEWVVTNRASLQRAWQTMCKRPGAQCRPLRAQGLPSACHVLSAAAADHAVVARCASQLVVATSLASATQALVALEQVTPSANTLAPLSSSARDTGPSAPLSRLSLDLAAFALTARQALTASSQAHPLQEWFPVHDLLLAGPLGDVLRDLDGLGGAEASVWRENGRVHWQWQQRRRPPAP